MARRHVFLGSLALLLSGMTAIQALEFGLDDPGDGPDMAMDCPALRQSAGSSDRPVPVDLHLEIHMGEKFAILSDPVGHDPMRMTLTGVVPTARARWEYLVLTHGSASAVVNLHFRDVVMADPRPSDVAPYDVVGRACRIAPLT